MNQSENNSRPDRSQALGCEAVRRDLPLYWYGELATEAEAAVEGHLSGCAACAGVWEQWKRTFNALDQDVLEPRAELLEECRAELADSLRLETPETPGSLLSKLWQQISKGVVLKPLPAFASALAMVAVGFFGARLVPAVTNIQPTQNAEDTRVRYVMPGENGLVRLVLEETRQREVEGRMEDDSIRGLLVRAAQHSTDPGLRVDSVELLNRDSGAFDVRNALLAVLERDPNAGVRQKAIEGLKAYAHEDEVRHAISDALQRDDDPSIRMQAIDTLMQLRRPDTVGVLQESIVREDNDYIRQRMLRALQEMNASAGTF